MREQRHRGIFPFPQKKSPAGKRTPNRASFLLGNFDGHVFDRKFREFLLQSLVRTPCGFFQHFSLLRCDLAVGDELVDPLFDKNSAAGGVGNIQNGPDRFVDFGDLFLVCWCISMTPKNSAFLKRTMPHCISPS